VRHQTLAGIRALRRSKCGDLLLYRVNYLLVPGGPTPLRTRNNTIRRPWVCHDAGDCWLWSNKLINRSDRRPRPTATAWRPAKPRRLYDLAQSQGPRQSLAVPEPWALSDTELLAVLLGSRRCGQSAVQASAEVLTDAGGLAELAKKDVDELENLGTQGACQGF
jgi:hypothetical protein